MHASSENLLNLKNALIREKMDLDDNLVKLRAFINSEKLEEIDPEHQALLVTQFEAMNTYSKTLQQRIDHIWSMIFTDTLG